MTTRPTKRRLARLVVPNLLLLAATGSLAMSLWTRRLAEQAELEHPRLGPSVEVEGISLSYAHRGRGSPVVLLHGAFGGLQDYTATIFDPLARKHRTIAFDLPGHAYSERPDRPMTPADHASLLHAATRELGVEKPIVVGFSFGGTVALAWALAYPDDVAGLVLINPVAYPWPGGVDPIYRIARWPVAGALLRHTLVMPLGRARTRASIERAFAPAKPPFAFSTSPIALALRPASFAAVSEDMAGLNAFVAEQCRRYAELRMPIEIVAGDGDLVAIAEHHSAQLARTVADGNLVIVPEIGHQLLFTRPKAVLEAVDRVAARATE